MGVFGARKRVGKPRRKDVRARALTRTRLLHARTQPQPPPRQAKTPAPAKMKEFKEFLVKEGGSRADLKALRAEVEAYATDFPMPGIDENAK